MFSASGSTAIIAPASALPGNYVMDSGTLVPASEAYAFFFDDGDLVIQRGSAAAEWRKPSGVYALTLDGSESVPWTPRAAEIQRVSISDVISPRSTSHWFEGCVNLTQIDGVENLDTSRVTDMSYMFYNCASLERFALNALDTSGVTNMGAMFAGCTSLETMDFSGMDLSHVVNISYLFSRCTSLRSVDLDDVLRMFCAQHDYDSSRRLPNGGRHAERRYVQQLRVPYRWQRDGLSSGPH